MKHILILIVLLITAQISYSQNSFKTTIRDDETNKPIAGAKVTVSGTEITGISDAAGNVELVNVPDGEQLLEIAAEGYEIAELKIVFPLNAPPPQSIDLTANEETVVITTTRTGREIDDEPTRVEAIDEEEIDEKSNMRPSNVSMILNESTGIKVQQTSATSYTQSVRIQGLDGRYTQILKDGFPAFGGFSGSLSLLDIPPLDLRQVEIIKGPASTFYGQGAIAGVINFVSKEPAEDTVTNLIFNQTSALGTDFSIFNSRKLERFGYTIFGSTNFQKEYDVDDDDFTELPRTRSFNVNPRLFLYPDDKTRVMIGNSTTFQTRQGGDVFVIRGRADGFHQDFENNDSLRNITTLQFDRDFSGGRKLVAKQSIVLFNRKITLPDYVFKGTQFNSYTDVSYFYPVRNHALVFGFNAVYDRFKETPAVSNAVRRDESRTTIGAFIQDSFSLSEKVLVEAGLRVDSVRTFGTFALPRISVLYKITDKLTSRAGFGLGYKIPTVFTEEAETLLFRNVRPIGDAIDAERSFGGTFDVNYRTSFGEKLSLSVNQMFFLTEIRNPLVLSPAPANSFRFANSSRPVTTSGFETNVRASYDFIKLFAGYTFTNAKAKYLAGNQVLPLTSKSKINSSLLLEKESNFKAGIEAYYSSSQFLNSGFRTKPFWVVGLFGEKTFGKVSFFVNAENVTDTRQSRFGPVVLPPHQNPQFMEIYTHTEGRIFNGGIKIKL